MNKNVLVYVPSQVSSIVQMFNKHLKNRYKEINQNENFYQIFIHKDLNDNLKDSQQFFNDYISFMQKWDMPYCFFPYYTYFNRVLPDIVNKPNPRVKLNIKDNGEYNIVNQICHGCIILNINKLKSINFLFDKDFPTIFYLQDLVQKCYENKLWLSNCWFLDRLDSWKDLKEINCKGWTFDGNKFQEEKKKYQEKKYQYHPVQVFIENLKKWRQK